MTSPARAMRKRTESLSADARRTYTHESMRSMSTYTGKEVCSVDARIMGHVWVCFVRSESRFSKSPFTPLVKRGENAGAPDLRSRVSLITISITILLAIN